MACGAAGAALPSDARLAHAPRRMSPWGTPGVAATATGRTVRFGSRATAPRSGRPRVALQEILPEMVKEVSCFRAHEGTLSGLGLARHPELVVTAGCVLLNTSGLLSLVHTVSDHKMELVVQPRVPPPPHGQTQHTAPPRVRGGGVWWP